MRSIIITSFLFLTTIHLKGQNVPVVSFSEFSTRLEPTVKNDTVYVINFWATWCKPCVEELPYFELLNENYGIYNLKITLVSLDFKSQYDKKLVPFVKDNDIKNEVILLNAPNYNDWISKVSKSWSGSIPATLIVHASSGTRMFIEKQFSNYEELEDLVKPFIND